MKKTIIFKGVRIIIDTAIMPILESMAWHVVIKNDLPKFYHSLWNKGSPKKITLEDVIKKHRKGDRVIHIDGNPRNFMPSNLKVVRG